MPSSPMKNLSEYVTYENYLKMDKAAKDFDNDARLKKVKRGSYLLLIRILFFMVQEYLKLLALKADWLQNACICHSSIISNSSIF
ncbi:hypothetical protein [Methanococcoides sp.]|jgi:hypothetical protein|uniref:hypothetical protein n=1 Tax=Methanococcoides sp. TaxID=1966350 RepID=UPI00272EBB82|nr:hypothetical protein [Methanococcoides sp.]